MNLGEIRQRVLEQADWQPDQAPSFVLKVNRLVNRAMHTLHDEAPFLFEGEARIVTYPDVRPVSGVVGDSVAVVATDPWVMTRAPVVGRTPWQFNGTWDGRWVEITDPAGQVHRRQTREWWIDDVTLQERFSLRTPWPNTVNAGMAYRVYTPDYFVPGDVVEVRQAKLYHSSRRTLTVSSRQDIERHRLFDFQGQQAGLPSIIYHGDHFQMPAPTLAPAVASAALWAGPDATGNFDYLYTYVWGTVDPEALTPLNLPVVRWESAPSPVSARITSGPTLNRLTLPNVDQELFFGVAGTARFNRSGFRKRIYGRRYTETEPAVVAESPQVFMLLAEVGGEAVTYDHDGSRFLDYQTRLKPVHGYRGLRIFPVPDGRYEVDCRVQYRPHDLVNDQDVPWVNEDAIDVLIEGSLKLLYEMDGKADMAQLSKLEYSRMLGVLTNRYAVLPAMFLHKSTARVRPSIGGVQRSKAATFREPS